MTASKEIRPDRKEEHLVSSFVETLPESNILPGVDILSSYCRPCSPLHTNGSIRQTSHSDDHYCALHPPLQPGTDQVSVFLPFSLL